MKRMDPGLRERITGTSIAVIAEYYSHPPRSSSSRRSCGPCAARTELVCRSLLVRPRSSAPRGRGRAEAVRFGPKVQLTVQEWLPILERLAAEARDVAAPLLGTTSGGAEIGSIGAGGDRTLEVDRQAEESMLAGLRDVASHGARFSVLSEEAGLIDLGADYPRIVIDPIDGSPNAARGLRMVGLMLSLLTGPFVRDVAAGVTMDLTCGERWTAVKGVGAFRDGRRIVPDRRPSGTTIEVLGLHALPSDVQRAWPLLSRVETFRQFYCMSLSLVYTAEGGIDVFCSSRRARIFDLTAGLLTIEESGGMVTDIDGHQIGEVPVDLETRTTLLCSAHKDLHDLALTLAADQSDWARVS